MMKKAAMSEKRLITAFFIVQTDRHRYSQAAVWFCLLLYITAAPAFRKLQKLRIFSALYSSI